MSSHSTKHASAVDFFSPPTDVFDPSDGFGKFYLNEQAENVSAFSVTHIENNEIVPINITPYKGFIEFWKSPDPKTVTYYYINADYLHQESQPEKRRRINEWLLSVPEGPVVEAEEMLMPPPLTRPVQRNVAEPKYGLLTGNGKKLVPVRKFTKYTTDNRNHEDDIHERILPVKEEPVLVRSPKIQLRKSAGVKRERNDEQDGYTQRGQSQPENVLEEGEIPLPMAYNEVSSNLQRSQYSPSEYAESEFENIRSHRIRMSLPQDWNDESLFEARQKARLERFKNDEERVPTRKEWYPPGPGSWRRNDFPANSGITTKQAHQFSRKHDVATHSPVVGNGWHQPGSNKREGSRRPIIIDGCNVAYGRNQGGRFFDSHGIKVCVDYFVRRGFTDIIVVVPEHRLTKRGCQDPSPLLDLHEKNMLITCWSKRLSCGRWATSYDDRMIVEIAHKRQGVIISNDRFRDIQLERLDWAETISERVIGFRFMPGDPNEIMFPSDPFGRYGPSFEEILKF